MQGYGGGHLSEERPSLPSQGVAVEDVFPSASSKMNSIPTMRVVPGRCQALMDGQRH